MNSSTQASSCTFGDLIALIVLRAGILSSVRLLPYFIIPTRGFSSTDVEWRKFSTLLSELPSCSLLSAIVGSLLRVCDSSRRFSSSILCSLLCVPTRLFHCALVLFGSLPPTMYQISFIHPHLHLLYRSWRLIHGSSLFLLPFPLSALFQLSPWVFSYFR